MIWIATSEKATAARESAKTILAKPYHRSVGETELHYLWIQLFNYELKASAGQPAGARSGFVMANSASDACASEQELRSQLIASRDANEKMANP